jgi:hypothetical protein
MSSVLPLSFSKEGLPEDVWSHLLSMVGQHELGVIACCSKTHRELVKEAYTWQHRELDLFFIPGKNDGEGDRTVASVRVNCGDSLDLYAPASWKTADIRALSIYDNLKLYRSLDARQLSEATQTMAEIVAGYKNLQSLRLLSRPTPELMDALQPSLPKLQRLYLNVELLKKQYMWNEQHPDNWKDGDTALPLQRELLALTVPHLVELELNIDNLGDDNFQAEILNVLAECLHGNASLTSLKLTNDRVCNFTDRFPLHIIDKSLKALSEAIKSCGALKKVVVNMPYLQTDGGLVRSLIGNPQLELVDLSVRKELLCAADHDDDSLEPFFEAGAKKVCLTYSGYMKQMVETLLALTPNLPELKLNSGITRRYLQCFRNTAVAVINELSHVVTALIDGQGKSLRCLDLGDAQLVASQHDYIKVGGDAAYTGPCLNYLLMRLISLALARPEMTIRLPSTITEGNSLVGTMAMLEMRHDVQKMWKALSAADQARLYVDDPNPPNVVGIEYFKYESEFSTYRLKKASSRLTLTC